MSNELADAINKEEITLDNTDTDTQEEITQEKAETAADFAEIAKQLQIMEAKLIKSGMTRKEINAIKGTGAKAKRVWPAELDKIKTRLTPVFAELDKWIETVFDFTKSDTKKFGQQYVNISLPGKYSLCLWNETAGNEIKAQKERDKEAAELKAKETEDFEKTEEQTIPEDQIDEN